jgi:hypothetical protein
MVFAYATLKIYSFTIRSRCVRVHHVRAVSVASKALIAVDAVGYM